MSYQSVDENGKSLSVGSFLPFMQDSVCYSGAAEFCPGAESFEPISGARAEHWTWDGETALMAEVWRNEVVEEGNLALHNYAAKGAK